MLQPMVDWPTDEPPCEGVPDAVLRRVTEYALGQNQHELTKMLLKLNFTQEEIHEFISVGTTTNASVPARCRPNSCNYTYCEGTLREVLLSYRSVHGYVSLVVCVFGIVANLLNVMVLTRKELANAPINRILTWLAVADLQVMIEYVPFAVYMYLVLPGYKDYPWLGAVFVLFHSHFAQVLHTISIFLTIALAIWRFISIRFPQHTHYLCTMQRCKMAISLSFVLPVVVCIPSFFTISVHESPVQDENATVYHLGLSDLARENNGLLYFLNFWVYSVVIKLLPCLILSLISAWLIKALYRANRRREQLRGYSAVAVLNGNCHSPQDPQLHQMHQLHQLRKPTRSERRTDRTTRMLLAILVLFLCTEFPQSILGLLSGLLGHNFFISCYQLFGEVMDIFALLNGAINFILYCTMSRQFRTTFGQLFKPRGLMAKFHGTTTSQTEVASTYV